MASTIFPPILPDFPITCQSFSKLSLMYVVKFPAILVLTIKMPTGVNFARVWTPVWILTFHWIVLNVKLKLILWSKISPRRSWRLDSEHLVRPNRYCLTLTPELKHRISRKNALRRIVQSTKNAGPNRLVRDKCVELGNRAFGDKLHSLRSGHKSFWNFMKIVKSKFRMTMYRTLFLRIFPVGCSFI
jgi:hypothetical protein